MNGNKRFVWHSRNGFRLRFTPGLTKSGTLLVTPVGAGAKFTVGVGGTVLLKIGGPEAEGAKPTGIHWHVSGGNRVTYASEKGERKDILWIRLERDGSVHGASLPFYAGLSRRYARARMGGGF